MPVGPCEENGQPGWRWGGQGKCYTYAPGDEAASGQAKRKAYLQGAAAEARGFTEKGDDMENVAKADPDGGDVHVPSLDWKGPERRKTDRRKGMMTFEEMKAMAKGDVPGHEFHGNQYESGAGSGGQSAHALSGGRVPGSIARHALDNLQVEPHIMGMSLQQTKEHLAAEHGHSDLKTRDAMVARVVHLKYHDTAKREDDAPSFTWVVKADAEPDERIVYGLVLVPDRKDSQDERVSAVEIEKASHDWMLNWQEQGIQHFGDSVPDIRPVQSYIAPVDFVVKGVDGSNHTVPKGSWVMASKIGDDVAWNMVKAQRLGGYSIQGSAIKREVK